MDRYGHRRLSVIDQVNDKAIQRQLQLEKKAAIRKEYDHDADDDASTAGASSESESEVTFESVLESSPTRRRQQQQGRRDVDSFSYNTNDDDDNDDPRSRRSSRRNRNSRLPSSSSTAGSSSSKGYKNNNNNNNNPHTLRELWGLTLAGALTGCLVGGPLCGAVGAGATAVAVTSHSQTGDVARKGGEAVAKLGDEASKLDKVNKLSKQAKIALSNMREKIRSFDEQNRVSYRVSEKIRSFDERHHLSERASYGACFACSERFRSKEDMYDDHESVMTSQYRVEDHSLTTMDSRKKSRVRIVMTA